MLVVVYCSLLPCVEFGGEPFFFFFKIFFFFCCGPFLKSLLNLLHYCFCFIVWFFGCKACRILASLPGTEPAPPAVGVWSQPPNHQERPCVPSFSSAFASQQKDHFPREPLTLCFLSGISVLFLLAL